MLARRGDFVARGKILDHLDIGNEAGSRETAFEQVVTENRVVGNPAFERFLEDIDVVDSLAAIGSLLEQVLIHVGNRERIGIKAARLGEQMLEQRTLAPDRHRGSHARLQDRVPFDDAPNHPVEHRTVQRVSHLPDQLPCRFSRQARVGIERDHIAHTWRHLRRLAVLAQERRLVRAPQQTVQLMKLAALALPADPLALACVPNTPPMQKREARRPPPQDHGGGSAPRYRRAPLREARRRRASSPGPRRSNPRAARNRGRRPCSRGSGPRADRPVAPPGRGSSAAPAWPQAFADGSVRRPSGPSREEERGQSGRPQCG